MKWLLLCIALACVLQSEAKRKTATTIVAINSREDVNRAGHHVPFRRRADTPAVDGTFLFLRRGQTFEVEIETSQKITGSDPISFEAAFLMPTKKKPQRIIQKNFAVKSTPHPSSPKPVYTVVVSIPENAPIGYYEGTWSLKDSNEKGKITKNLVILFNAWAEKDPVYVKEAVDRDEYVLNEQGLIWVGSYNDYSAAPWKYNQFDGLSLETALVGLHNPPLSKPEDYADPVIVSRKLSFAAGDSICWGKWSGNYTHEQDSRRCGYKCKPDSPFPNSAKKQVCTEPWKWRDVSQMLEMHKINNNTRVQIQWCQCFVFAALLNSLGRSIGLPTRAVTNFQSAADHNINNKIEKYYTEKDGYFNEEDDNPQAEDPDSVWNFHVWNEAFFRRPSQKTKSGKDLNLDGWQAFDGTPQVESPHSNKYEMGPASLAAVYRNQVQMDFDVKFVVSEVNANVTVMVKKEDGTWFERFNSEKDPFDPKRYVGQKLSTKKPGAIYCNGTRACEHSRLDLTNAYKKPETSGPLPSFDKRTIGDVEAKLVFPAENEIVNRGEKVNYGYIFHNNADEDISIHVLLKVDAVDYTDKKLFKIASTKKIINVPAGNQYKFVKTLRQDDYDELFEEELIMGAAYAEFTFSARVDGDGSVFFHKKLLQIHDDSQAIDVEDFFF